MVSRYLPASIFTMSFCPQRLPMVRPATPSMESSKSLGNNPSRNHCTTWDLVATVASLRIRNSTIVVARNRTGTSVIPYTGSLERGNSKLPTSAATLIKDCPRFIDRAAPNSTACWAISKTLALVQWFCEASQTRTVHVMRCHRIAFSAGLEIALRQFITHKVDSSYGNACR